MRRSSSEDQRSELGMIRRVPPIPHSTSSSPLPPPSSPPTSPSSLSSISRRFHSFHLPCGPFHSRRFSSTVVSSSSCAVSVPVDRSCAPLCSEEAAAVTAMSSTAVVRGVRQGVKDVSMLPWWHPRVVARRMARAHAVRYYQQLRRRSPPCNALGREQSHTVKEQ